MELIALVWVAILTVVVIRQSGETKRKEARIQSLEKDMVRLIGELRAAEVIEKGEK